MPPNGYAGCAPNPFILYTGYSEQTAEERLSAIGIHNLLRNPLDIPTFRSVLEGLLPSQFIAVHEPAETIQLAIGLGFLP